MINAVRDRAIAVSANRAGIGPAGLAVLHPADRGIVMKVFKIDVVTGIGAVDRVEAVDINRSGLELISPKRPFVFGAGTGGVQPYKYALPALAAPVSSA